MRSFWRLSCRFSEGVAKTRRKGAGGGSRGIPLSTGNRGPAPRAPCGHAPRRRNLGLPDAVQLQGKGRPGRRSASRRRARLRADQAWNVRGSGTNGMPNNSLSPRLFKKIQVQGGARDAARDVRQSNVAPYHRVPCLRSGRAGSLPLSVYGGAARERANAPPLPLCRQRGEMSGPFQQPARRLP